MIGRILQALRNAGLPLGALGGVPIKLHISFPALLGAAALLSGDPAWAAALCLMLFVLSLLHECMHWAAARTFGGYHEEIILWPLGGLAEAETPLQPLTQLLVAAAGPLFHLAVLLLFLPWALGSFPVPLWPLPRTDYLTLFLCLNQLLLIANLLPAFLTDGGRLWQSILWRLVGFSKATAITLSAAFFLGLGGTVVVVLGGTPLFGLGAALLLLSVIYYERAFRVAEVVDGEWIETPALYAGLYHRRRLFGKIRNWWGKRRQEREHLQRVKDAQLLDSILHKINKSGISSLTSKERRFLQRQSHRLKRQRGFTLK